MRPNKISKKKGGKIYGEHKKPLKAPSKNLKNNIFVPVDWRSYMNAVTDQG